MYLGSVKFYKHLIYITIVTILVLALIGLGFLISLAIPNASAEAANKTDNDIAGMDDINNTFQYQNLENDADKIDDNRDSSEQEDKSEEDKINPDSDKPDDNNSEEPTIIDTYPNLYCEKSEIVPTDKKTAYISFDDGPSANTEKILDILKERNIKATFFVITGDYNSHNLDLLKKITDEGHTVGIHSHTHIYKEIYDSKESFLKELNNSFNIIYEKTNIKPDIIRFPGGSINKFNQDIYEDITAEVLKRNFQYYDWNVSFEDAKNNSDVDEIYQSALYGIEKNIDNNLIILAHDKANNDNTIEALKKVIDVLESYGYSFDKLDNSVEPITFSNK